MAECLALADLDANINLMPLSVWNKLSLPNLSPTCMTLEFSDRSISHLVGVAEDVNVKVGTFDFPPDFVVVDFDFDPRVHLILGRSFLKTERALIDVFEGELTLRVGKEGITFNLDQTSRYSANYNDMTANRIDVIDMACEEYSLETSRDVVAPNPKAFVDDVVKAFEKAGDEKKSKCLEFLLGNHPIELLHPYTMMLQKQNICSIFSLLLHFLYRIFCGEVSGGGGRLWWWR
nr:reverse transcriptase domain-containing protein [Tanacetum cinerariifolium]